ncbi:hypothetical protein D3C76_1670830 [compost metagenome]
MRHQLAAEETPGNQADGGGGQADSDRQGDDQAIGTAVVLDQKKQAAEQAGNRGNQHQDDGCFEH